MHCPGCAGEFPEVDGPTHPYMTSSPGCWAAFGDVLAQDYSDPARMAFHQVVVDSYAAQHPGDGSRKAVQSVGLHLMTLCLFLEHDVEPAEGPRLHQRMIDKPDFHALDRTGPGRLTVAHMSAEDPRTAALDWARSVWDSYGPSHDIVREWLRQAGFAS